MSSETLACTYAALLINDAGLPVTADSINAALTAANVTVNNTLPILFARFLEKRSIESLFAAAASAAAPAPAAGAAAAAAPAAAAAAAPAAGKPAAPAEEEDDEMGFDLFG